jgi:hypothetical protein
VQKIEEITVVFRAESAGDLTATLTDARTANAVISAD